MSNQERVNLLLVAIQSGSIDKFLHFCKVMHEKGKPHILEALEVDIDYIEKQLVFREIAQLNPTELNQHIEEALQRGLQGGKKTVCRSRVVLIGHYAAGKTSLKRCLLKEDFVDEHIETDGIVADPSTARVDITKTKGWQIHKVEHEYREEFISYIVQQVTKPSPKETAEQVHHGDADNKTDGPRNIKRDVATESLKHEEVKIKTEAKKKLHAELPDLHQFLVELFFWDFGGQSVYYNTHMTFLTRQSIYIVVMDMTKALSDEIPTWCLNQMGEQIRDSSCPQTVAEYLDYWCSCVHTFVPPEMNENVTHGQAATPAIIIVGTHRDNCSEEEVETFEREIQAYIASKPYENQINKEVFTISNKFPDRDNIENLKDKIVSLATMQSYELPMSWVKFKEVMTYKAGSGKRIPFKEAKMIGSQLHLDERDVILALKFFHGVGDVIYFSEEKLRDLIITDPQWLIDQFRLVITIPKYRERHFADSGKHWNNLYKCGVLHEAVLNNVWSKDVKDELTALMKKFGLLCEITAPELIDLDYEEVADHDGSHKLFLVPSLIGSKDQDQSEEGLVPPVFLMPSGKFIPIGLTSRLIAGLINEDGWQLVHVAKDAATYLPNGEDSVVDVSIKAMKDRIEVSGTELAEVKTDSDLASCLDIVHNRLDAITSSVCPQRSFTVSIQCLECKKKGKDLILPLKRKHLLSGSVYCKGCRTNRKTSKYSRLFCKRAAEASSSSVNASHPSKATNILTQHEMENLLINHKKDFFERFDLSLRVRAALRAAKVITDDTENELCATGITPDEKINIVLETVSARGVRAFLDFCHVLCQKDISQEFLVTEVLQLNISDIERQREDGQTNLQ